MTGSNRKGVLLLISSIITCLQLPVVLSQLATAQPNRFSVVEKSQPGTYIGSVFDSFNLTDLYPDPNDRVNLRFSFRASDPDSTYFSINESTGIITTSSKSVNRDTICAYLSTCLLQFQVQILPPRYFQVFNVYVVVVDINDHSPTFVPSSLRLNISESDPPGKLFLLPGADDPDGGIDGIQGYRLEPNSSTKFQLSIANLADGSADVRLLLLERLKRSEVNSYSLVVLAFDGGTPSRSGSLTISITVVDSTTSQQSLIFENSTYEANVVENLPTGTSVLQVHASYQGTSGNSSNANQIVYGIDRSSQQNQPTYFGINNRTGVVYIAIPLDHERHPVVLVTLTATDPSRISSFPVYARVTVFVSDSNDNAPVITVTTLTADGIAEVTDSSPVGSFVAYIGVSDADGGVNGQVGCVVNDTTSFRLESVYTDYKLKTGVAFGGGDSPVRYAVAVTCVDRGSPPMTSSVVVGVRVVLTGPVFASVRTIVDVYEGNRIGDRIVSLNVSSGSTDTDSTLSFGYSSLGDSPANAISVDVTLGVVTSNVVFSYDVRRQYSYVVTVSDVRYSTVTSSSTLIVNILRVALSTGSGSSRTPDVAVVSPVATPGNTVSQATSIMNTDTVIIAAVVCATVIVVVITVVVAAAIVCYRRNQQKALVSAALQLAKGPSSVCSDGASGLVRSTSSVSSSIESTNGDKRDSKLGSIREESFEDLQTKPVEEWPPKRSSYPDCGLDSTPGLNSPRRNLYERSISQPDNHHHHHHHRRRHHRASARNNDNRMAEDGSDASRDGESSSCYSGSLTDSGQGLSLQDDSCLATVVNGNGLQYSHPPPPPPPQSQVLRQDSDCSGASSNRPLIPPTTKYPIENKIYITNHFRDALPRQPFTRVQPGAKRDREDPEARLEALRRADYFDARSRAGHADGMERSSGHWVTPVTVEKHSTFPSSYEGVGEFTQSLYPEDVGFAHRSSRKETTAPGDEPENEIRRPISGRSGRTMRYPEEEDFGGGAADSRVCDTFV